MIEQQLRTALTELVGVRHPVVQTGMGWVAGPRLVSGTARSRAAPTSPSASTCAPTRATPPTAATS